MCNKNDLPLSLKSDTFNALCSDFDQVLRATLQGMDETSQDVAEVNVKVKITLTPDSRAGLLRAGDRTADPIHHQAQVRPHRYRGHPAEGEENRHSRREL